jgi:large subunit ribosomal protein L22
MEFRAQARFMRVSPQKARLVLDLIKGRRVEDALNTLTFTKKRVAATVHKLLRSALENANYLSAEKGLDIDVDSLYVKNAIANDGPRMKRIRPAPMGRAFHYVRRISHIEIELAERGKNGEALTNVAGAERVSARAPAKQRTKAAGKTPARTAKKSTKAAKKFAGAK